jgi:hypothetical protein
LIVDDEDDRIATSSASTHGIVVALTLSHVRHGENPSLKETFLWHIRSST